MYRKIGRNITAISEKTVLTILKKCAIISMFINFKDFDGDSRCSVKATASRRQCECGAIKQDVEYHSRVAPGNVSESKFLIPSMRRRICSVKGSTYKVSDLRLIQYDVKQVV